MKFSFGNCLVLAVDGEPDRLSCKYDGTDLEANFLFLTAPPILEALHFDLDFTRSGQDVRVYYDRHFRIRVTVSALELTVEAIPGQRRGER